MRIALVTSSYHPAFGGVEEHVRNVAEVLRRREHEVTVWCVSREGRSTTALVDGVTVHYLPCPLPARSAGSVAAFLGQLPRAVRAWARAYRADRPDLLHVHCFGPNGTYAQAAARVVRRPLVLSAHGETVADADAVFQSSALLRWSLRRALRDADAVTGCSQMALDDLVDRFGLDPAGGIVVFNGIDPGEPPSSTPAELPDRYLLAVGRVVRTKGFDLLVRAFAGADLPAELRLVIGGDGPELAALKTLGHRLGVADRVVFPGRLSRPQVVSGTSRAEALVVPSRVEPFGITVLEGWRAGVPVIATTRGGPPEFVRDGVDGLLVDPEDTAALGSALEHVESDPAAAQRMAVAGQGRLPEFTWERTTQAYEEIYRDLVG